VRFTRRLGPFSHKNSWESRVGDSGACDGKVAGVRTRMYLYSTPVRPTQDAHAREGKKGGGVV
jgi:hypothetical protein